MEVPKPEKANHWKEAAERVATLALAAVVSDVAKEGANYMFSHWHEIAGLIENTAHLLF